MPVGYPRAEPLPLCAREGCLRQVNDSRQKYCSYACFGVARKALGIPRRYPKAKDSQRIVIAPKPNGQSPAFRNYPQKGQAKEVTRPLDYWWMAKDLPREGLTALASTKKFSQDKKAVPAPNWIG